MEAYTRLLTALTEKTQGYFATVKEIQSLLGQSSCLPLDRFDDAGLLAVLELRRQLGLRHYGQGDHAIAQAASRIPECSSTLEAFLKNAERALTQAAKDGRCGLLPRPTIVEAARQLAAGTPTFDALMPIYPPARPPLQVLIAWDLLTTDSPWKRTFDQADGATLLLRISAAHVNAEVAGGAMWNMAAAPREMPAWFARDYVHVVRGETAFSRADLQQMRRQREAREAAAAEIVTARERAEEAQRHEEQLRQNAYSTRRAWAEQAERNRIGSRY
jgi:hypothetical protein